MNNLDTFDHEIAIIGMNGRFPGAKNVEEFWQNLQGGVESISFFSDHEVVASGIDPDILNNPRYVKAHGILEDIELFDASFFGFSPGEAATMDPQQRLFLECAWEALESAGYAPETYEGRISVYAGTSRSSYLNQLRSNRDLVASLGSHQIILGNERDFLSTRVSYKLNLRGPSITVQTACSTSLVATHLACQSLLNGESDIALAGGVSIIVPQKTGYLYQEGMIFSPDGHCRAFDGKAQGIVGGNGVGVVVLKRLVDALADGDCIQAVIKGSAINNDGSSKIGYTAPGVDGQAEVIVEALTIAGIEPDTVTYIETHGTGTPLGDPIEIAALTQAFHTRTEKKGFCAIGSVKTNVGHLDNAAGIAGLIKTILALKHRLLPPSLHFEQPNPKIDFAHSPFYVNTTLTEWKAAGFPRRAGVSSFGIGGTNAHVLLEEAPPRPISEKFRPPQLLILSTKTSSALETATDNLVTYLQQHADLNLADVAYTLQVGRQAFSYRQMIVCHNLHDGVAALDTRNPQRVFTAFQESRDRPVVFLFPGQGAQYVYMAAELYQLEPTFRKQVDLCSEFLKVHLKVDLRNVLYPGAEAAEESAHRLNQTFLTQPALFVIEYALAKLWIEWGMHPQSMIGHSIGEYVAACLADVFSLEDALRLVVARGQLMQNLPGGTMLVVPLPEKAVRPFLGTSLSIAANNGPSLCVVSGPTDAVEELKYRIAEKGITCHLLHTSHAFHSAMVEPVLEPFTEQIKKVKLHAPRIPYISNVTGTWITSEETTDPQYWAQHLRQTVRFAEGMAELLKKPDSILLEVGPGQALSQLAKQQVDSVHNHTILTSLPLSHNSQSDTTFLLSTLGQLWLAGAYINWLGFHTYERCQRVLLPTYPFERQRFWIKPQQKAYKASNHQTAMGKRPHKAYWFYVPSWKQSVPLEFLEQGTHTTKKLCWLVFVDTCGLGSQIASRLRLRGQQVITVTIGERFSQTADKNYTLNPRKLDDYVTLCKELFALDQLPGKIVHLWNITTNDPEPTFERFEKAQYLGFYSLLSLSQTLGTYNSVTSLEVMVVSNNIQNVIDEEGLCPEKATTLGPCKVIPQDYLNISCRAIDIVLPKPGTWQEENLIDSLITELAVKSSDQIIAYRGKHRWVQTFEHTYPNGEATETTCLRDRGVYLIISRLEDFGFPLAEYLTQTVQARLVIVEPSSFLARDEWTQEPDISGMSRTIQQIQALEDAGADVLILSADVTNHEQMQAVLNQTFERFGTIHGIIHLAWHDKETFFTSTAEEQYLQSTMRELFVLEQVLQGRKLDFCLLCPSPSSVSGGAGHVINLATNLLIDAFTRHHNQMNPVSWTSVYWNDRQFKKEQEAGLEGSHPELTPTLKDFTEVLQYLLSMCAATQLIVSVGDLQTQVNHIPLQETEYTWKGSTSAQLRPDLPSANVTPKNEIEQTIAVIWQELLGINQLSIHDNFFELGGHSLMAAQLIPRLQEAFLVEVPLRSIFDAPTIAGLAVVVEEMFLEKLKALSEEDAQRLMVSMFHHN